MSEVGLMWMVGGAYNSREGFEFPMGPTSSPGELNPCYSFDSDTGGLMKRLWLVFGILGLVACGDDVGLVNPGDAVADTLGVDVAQLETMVPDTQEQDTAPPVDVAPKPCEPGTGCFEESCDDPDDCNSSICTSHLGD